MPSPPFRHFPDTPSMDLLGSRRPRRSTSTAPWRRVLSPLPSSSSSAPSSDLQESDVLWSHRDISSSVIDTGGSDVRRGNLSSSSSFSSYSSSSRPIPIVPTKKAEARVDAVARSEPMHIPRRRVNQRRDAELEEDEEEEDDEENGKWLPPHEIVARTWERRNMTCYSVLEGAGRTLKGRDLHRVRDAVLQKTGFFD